MAGVASCKKDNGAPPDMGYNYFPDQPGNYVIYNVDSFYYDDFYDPTTIDTFKFQLKEKIESVFMDNQGRPTLRLERYVRYYNESIPYNSLPWILRDVWSANKNMRVAEKVEENVRYVRLSFPVKETQTWDGNAQNTEGEMNYSYRFFDVSRTIGNILFDSVLQVDQQDINNLIEKRFYIEKYARNVGLVQKHVIDIQSQPNPDWSDPVAFPFGNDSLSLFYNKPILSRVDSGHQYIMTVISFGTE
ncbi:MAG: hypothetical protein M3R27_10505 [Bacteroidota bacterium]|nr:hypothetical protein [Bacteroidota bacterium]